KPDARGQSRDDDGDPFLFMFSNKRDTTLGEIPAGTERHVLSLLEERSVIPAKMQQPLRQEQFDPPIRPVLEQLLRRSAAQRIEHFAAALIVDRPPVVGI